MTQTVGTYLRDTCNSGQWITVPFAAKLQGPGQDIKACRVPLAQMVERQSPKLLVLRSSRRGHATYVSSRVNVRQEASFTLALRAGWFSKIGDKTSNALDTNEPKVVQGCAKDAGSSPVLVFGPVNLTGKNIGAKFQMISAARRSCCRPQSSHPRAVAV